MIRQQNVIGIKALPILEELQKRHRDVFTAILDRLAIEEHEFDAITEELRERYLDSGGLEECGGCGCYHRKAWNGDCRTDSERF